MNNKAFKITKETVVAKPRKLQASWKLESLSDYWDDFILRSWHHIEVEGVKIYRINDFDIYLWVKEQPADMWIYDVENSGFRLTPKLESWFLVRWS